VVCNNRKVSKSTPNITRQFSFSEEQVQEKSITYIKDLSYDSVLNAIRYERRNSKKEPSTFYSRDPLITVHDYNVGVSNLFNQFVFIFIFLSFFIEKNLKRFLSHTIEDMKTAL